MKRSIIAISIALMTATATFAQEANGGSNTSASQQTTGEFGEILMAQARTEAQVIAALELQGYEVSDTRRSLLGRVIITAQNELHVREVVMSRATGEILSDQIIAMMGDASATASAGRETGTANDASSGSANTSARVGVDLSAKGGDDDNGPSVSVGGSGGASVSIGIGN